MFKAINRRVPAGMHEQGKKEANFESTIGPRMTAERLKLCSLRPEIEANELSVQVGHGKPYVKTSVVLFARTAPVSPPQDRIESFLKFVIMIPCGFKGHLLNEE